MKATECIRDVLYWFLVASLIGGCMYMNHVETLAKLKSGKITSGATTFEF